MEIDLNPNDLDKIERAAEEVRDDPESKALVRTFLSCLTLEEVEEIERLLEDGDIEVYLDDMVAEWDGQDTDVLLSLFESRLADIDVAVQYEVADPELDEGHEVDEMMYSD
jgi:hypothetical protein